MKLSDKQNIPEFMAHSESGSKREGYSYKMHT